jgi:alpha-galactosidase
MPRKISALIAILQLLILAGVAGQSASLLSFEKGWKFQPGDDPAYARPGFDDSKWGTLKMDRVWEEQGFEKLDGFAWYRLRFVLPSKLRDSAALKDGLRLDLGKINNFDQSYLNGAIFGINGKAVPASAPVDTAFTKADASLYNLERIYVLPVDDPRLRWDAENVLAVRVFDEGGQGGMWSGGQNARMVAVSDYLAGDQASRPFLFRDGKVTKKYGFMNRSGSRTLNGTLSVRAVSKLTKGEISKTAEAVSLPPNASREFEAAFPAPDQAVRVLYEFAFDGFPEKWLAEEEIPYVLTPRPPAEPRINGPLVYGARPGHPFLFAVPATGERPITYGASGLPSGLSLDPVTGIISGRAAGRGEFPVLLTARNARGEARRGLKIVVGDAIALTPPMGWNSWNCWGLAVDEEKAVASARVFKEKGLLDHGWSYINIDDGWEIKGDSPAPKRDARGDILTNEKFKDIKRLGDRLHALGLKFGIYSSPGPLTCGGYTATYGYEANDARSFGAWGVDYLKYDWCSYDRISKGETLEELKKPYLVMRRELDKTGRDIVFSLCQYGMGKVWEWGATVGGNSWRTTEDITDTWESLRAIGFSQVDDAPFAGPGHWNDPDMLVVGWVGWGPSLHPSHLTPDEQYTHISLWSLLSAPLLIGCDLTRLDDFTLNLLTNDEVLALDQDPLGKAAVPRIKTGDIQVWVKELYDGSRAVGIFNLGAETAGCKLSFKEIGTAGKCLVRDLWRQKDLGAASETFETKVPAHGVVLLRLSRAN